MDDFIKYAIRRWHLREEVVTVGVVLKGFSPFLVPAFLLCFLCAMP